MNKLTRRSFGKRLLAASALPLVNVPSFAEQTANPGPAFPDTIAGYRLTGEDKLLAMKFLANHEKNMLPLRGEDLPNTLPPAFIFASLHPKNQIKSR